MKYIILKIAAVVATIIGLMAVITGSRVLTGNLVQNYHVITGLVVYNVLMGVISIGAGMLIWIEKKVAYILSGVIMGAHIVVLIILQTILNDVVADQSINAMIFRSVIWSIITIIVYFGKRNILKAQ